MEHSVTLDKEKCKGCVNCVKHCHTQAIRVRNGKATILGERCIDCAECIRICENQAKKAVMDPMELMEQFDYTVALPAPSFYAQFHRVDDPNLILTGLKRIGFDEVFEVALAAQYITRETVTYLAEHPELQRPVLSSACPAIVKLIRIRYPELVDRVLPLIAPVEYAAIAARKLAVEQTGLAPEQIGIFLIAPCPAKATVSKDPLGLEQPVIDATLSMAQVYKKVNAVLGEIEEPEVLLSSLPQGIGWAVSGGESALFAPERCILADGIENASHVLEMVEDTQLSNIDFIELNCCPGGCLGGCLTVENPFLAKARLQHVMNQPGLKRRVVSLPDVDVHWRKKLSFQPVGNLGGSIEDNIQTMRKIEELYQQLPGVDCGSCGAPDCRCFAQDVVLGYASVDDCIFRIRDRLRDLLEQNPAFQELVPVPFRRVDDKAEQVKEELPK